MRYIELLTYNRMLYASKLANDHNDYVVNTQLYRWPQIEDM